MVRHGKITTSIPCDFNCEAKKNLKDQEDLKEKVRLQEIEEEKNKKELELYEKKFGPKKIRERKIQVQEEMPTFSSQHKILLLSLVAMFLAALFYFLITK